jgi:hypothetical protein
MKLASHGAQLSVCVSQIGCSAPATVTNPVLSLQSTTQMTIVLPPTVVTSTERVCIVPRMFLEHAERRRHQSHRQGFLLSRLAALDVMGQRDSAIADARHTVCHHNENMIPMLTGLIDRSASQAHGALISYSHEDIAASEASSPHSTPNCLAAALVSRRTKPSAALSSLPSPLRIAVDIVAVDRIQSVCTRNSRWPSRWLGPSNACASMLPCHWAEMLPSSLWRPANCVPLHAQCFTNLAVGWGVRECAVKLLGASSRAFRMSSITSVQHRATVAPADGGSPQVVLPYEVAFDGVDADAWRSQKLQPMFRFGVVSLDCAGRSDGVAADGTSGGHSFVVVVAVVD